MDVKNFYLNMPLDQYKYMHMKLYIIYENSSKHMAYNSQRLMAGYTLRPKK